MKYKKLKKLRYQIQRSKRELKRRRIKNGTISKRKNKVKKKKIVKKAYTTVTAPNNFSLINNTEEVLKYINTCNELRKQNNKVEYKLREIEKLTDDAIALHIADFINREYKTNDVVTMPKKQEIRDKLISSGILNYVHLSTNSKKQLPEEKAEKLLIHRENTKPISNWNWNRNTNKVEPGIAKDAVLLATRFTLGEEKKFRPIYEILI